MNPKAPAPRHRSTNRTRTLKLGELKHSSTQELNRNFYGCSLTSAVIRSGSLLMGQVNVEQIKSAIRDIPDFPKPGVLFKDITPILGDGKLFKWVINRLAEEARKANPSKLVGIDARGFLFGAAVAYELGVGCVPVRKKGKLPFKTIGSSYKLEYGTAEVEMHIDAITAGERVVLIDDLLATGGTSAAAVNLVQKVDGIVGSALFLIELAFLNGREKLPPDLPVYSMVQF